LGAALLAASPAARAADALPEDVRFQTETLLTALPQPMHLEFAPDGRLWFNEYAGALKIYDPKTKRVKLVAEMEIFKSQENGFLAFALDPKFAQNGWIYLIYSPVGFDGQYLSRFQVKDDQLVAGSEKLILKYEEQRLQCCHHGATLKFGPDGCLYFSTGDNTSPFGDSKGYAPLDQRPGKEPWDGQRTSANTNTLVGKVNRIRVHDDATYSIPEGNLFKPGTPKTRPEIFAMGTRNPWRLSIDPKTGYVYWGEVGPDARVDGPRGSRGYDEINQAKKAGNHGYPLFVGNNFPYAEYDYATEKVGALFDPKAPLNKSRNNTGLVELPPAVPAFIYWPYAVSEQWPELGEGGRTACAGPVFYWQESYEKTEALRPLPALLGLAASVHQVGPPRRELRPQGPRSLRAHGLRGRQHRRTAQEAAGPHRQRRDDPPSPGRRDLRSGRLPLPARLWRHLGRQPGLGPAEDFLRARQPPADRQARRLDPGRPVTAQDHALRQGLA
jgi:cytochrome c